MTIWRLANSGLLFELAVRFRIYSKHIWVQILKRPSKFFERVPVCPSFILTIILYRCLAWRISQAYSLTLVVSQPCIDVVMVLNQDFADGVFSWMKLSSLITTFLTFFSNLYSFLGSQCLLHWFLTGNCQGIHARYQSPNGGRPFSSYFFLVLSIQVPLIRLP